MVFLQLIHVGWLSERVCIQVHQSYCSPRIYLLDNVWACQILLELPICILNWGSDFYTKSPNFKSLVLTFLSKAFLSLLWYPWMWYKAFSLFSSSMHNWSYLLCNQSASKISLSSIVLSERTPISIGRTASIPIHQWIRSGSYERSDWCSIPPECIGQL